MTSNRLMSMSAAVILFSLTVYFMGPLAQSYVDSVWLRPGVTETIGLVGPVEITQSSIIQHKAMLAGDILPLFGSSELRSGRGFAPGVIFAGKPTGFTTYYMGGALFQSLPHLINLAGQEDISNRKLVVLLPPDWFFSVAGLSPANFSRNFSPEEVYQMLFSPSLPAPLRQSIIKRILQYPQVLKDHPVLDSFLKSYVNTGWKADLGRLVLWPAARIDFASMQLQDAINTIKYVRKLNPKMIAWNGRTSPVEREPPWGKLTVQAVKQGESVITNTYGVDDAGLAKFVTGRGKGAQRKANLDKSPEYHDLELLLKVLQAKRAKPLFVIVPFNGPYRDYTGLPVAQRRQHYQRLRELIARYGFPFADLSSREDQPYYFNDPVHISGRGWVYVDEILDNFYHGKEVL